MTTALTVLGVMLVTVVGLGALVCPIIAFIAYDDDSKRHAWLRRARWWSIGVPFVVIPLLVALVGATGFASGTADQHCGPGTRYVDMGKGADPSWMCMGEAR